MSKKAKKSRRVFILKGEKGIKGDKECILIAKWRKLVEIGSIPIFTFPYVYNGGVELSGYLFKRALKKGDFHVSSNGFEVSVYVYKIKKGPEISFSDPPPSNGVPKEITIKDSGCVAEWARLEPGVPYDKKKTETILFEKGIGAAVEEFKRRYMNYLNFLKKTKAPHIADLTPTAKSWTLKSKGSIEIISDVAYKTKTLSNCMYIDDTTPGFTNKEMEEHTGEDKI